MLDSASGSIHAVDEVAYDIIAEFEKTDKETLAALSYYGVPRVKVVKE